MELRGQHHAPAALPSREELPVSQATRLGGPQSWSGRGDEERNPINAPPENWTPVVQPVA